MKWNKYTLKINEDAEDIVIATLAEIGVQGVEIEDKKPLTQEEMDQMFVDIAPSFGEDDKIAYLHFYLEPEEDNDAILAAANEELEALKQFMDIGEAKISKSQTEDKDWINNWKEYFHHFYVDDILIVPSWEEVPAGDEDKMILHIDPGTAFGTGMHETTQLCIRQLKKHVKSGMKVLDVGTGSGILSIVAIKLGAQSALGTDLDPCTINAVKENKEVNEIPEEAFQLVLGNIIDDPQVQEIAGYEKYDLATANILADVLIPLAPQVWKHLKKDGILICSGILDIKEEDVKTALTEAGFSILEVTAQGEWVSITAKK